MYVCNSTYMWTHLMQYYVMNNLCDTYITYIVTLTSARSSSNPVIDIPWEIGSSMHSVGRQDKQTGFIESRFTISLYVYIYIYIYTEDACICIYICTFVYLYICTFVCIYIYVHLFMYIFRYVHLFMYIFTYVHLYLFIYIYIYTYVHL